MLDEAAYRLLLPQSARVAPYTYRSVTPNSSKQLPPGTCPLARDHDSRRAPTSLR